MTIHSLAANLVMLCRARNLTVTTAESCTGGLVAGAITAISGASAVLDRGYVTYSNAAKTELLGVPPGLIEAVGAVSEAVARRMAEGAKTRAGADLAVAITGIAGPGGGTPQKPVGLVWFGIAGPHGALHTFEKHFAGSREAVRHASVLYALSLLLAGAKQ